MRFAGAVRYPDGGLTAEERARRERVRLAAANYPRLSLTALLATMPGHRPRLIYRAHPGLRTGGRRRGLTEADYAVLLGAAHRQFGGLILLIWDNLNTLNAAMAELITARPWLTVFRLPQYAHKINPVELVWVRLEQSLANLTKHDITELTALVKTRLRRMQHRPGPLAAVLANIGLEFGQSLQHPPRLERSLVA